VALPSECLHLRGWERKDGEDLQRGYQGYPHFAAGEDHRISIGHPDIL
jgi:hypothetical protein